MKQRVLLIGLISLSFIIGLGSSGQAAEKIKVGVILPLTGASAYTGDLIKKGIDLAVEEINVKGGIDGALFETVYYDTRVTPKEGVAAVNRLITQDGVKFVLGEVSSSVTLAVMPITEENKVIQINFSYSPKITEMGHKLIFRDGPGSAITMPPLTEFLASKKNLKNWSVLVVNNDYGRGDGDEFKKGIEKNSGKVLSYDYVEFGTTDFYPFITKIKGLNPEGIRITVYEDHGISFVKQLRELGFKGTLSTCDMVTDDMPLEKLGKLADGIYSETVYEPGLFAASRAFEEAHFKKYGKHTQRNSAMGYHAIDILARAIKKVGSAKDTEKIATAMKELRYESVWGPSYFDAKGQLQMPAHVVEIKNAKRVIVYP